MLEGISIRRHLYISHFAAVFSPEIEAQIEYFGRDNLLEGREALGPEDTFTLPHPSVELLVPHVPQKLVNEPLLLAKVGLGHSLIKFKYFQLAFFR